MVNSLSNKSNHCFSFPLVCLLFALPAQAQRPASTVDQGTIDGGQKYRNSKLGMVILLPGTWDILGKATTAGPASSSMSKSADCRGPLCEHPSINVAMLSRSEAHRDCWIFLVAYKLTSEYDDARKHSLKDFANVMIVRSLGKLWVPDSGLTPLRLGGRAALRLATHSRNMPTAKAFMYVSKSNGYVFMLIATSTSSTEDLRPAVENMQLGN